MTRFTRGVNCSARGAASSALLGEHHIVHQRRQRETANAERRLLEEMAAGDGAQLASGVLLLLAII